MPSPVCPASLPLMAEPFSVSVPLLVKIPPPKSARAKGRRQRRGCVCELEERVGALIEAAVERVSEGAQRIDGFQTSHSAPGGGRANVVHHHDVKWGEKGDHVEHGTVPSPWDRY